MEPNQKPKTGPKDFFLYLGVMVMLYASVIALINLLFAYINYAFPDQLYSGYDPYLNTVRWGMAFLFIIFPAFLFGTWYINNDIRKNSDKEGLGIRKWLTYLALFVAGAAVLVDLSILIYTFLGGEITTRFGLKVLVVLVVSAFGLSYYLLDLRGKIRASKNLGHVYGIVAGLLVLASIVGGFFVVGSPSTQRAVRFDNQRVSDLQSIQWQIVNYWQQRQAFPKDLSALNDQISGFTVPKDPKTGAAYEYKLGEGMAFELCATFERESREGDGSITKPMRVDYGLQDDVWTHGVGNKCFERVLDPKRYPPFEKVPERI